MNDKGYHYMIDAIVKDEYVLKNKLFLRNLFLGLLNESKFNVINYLTHQFSGEGQGITGIFLLSESHLSFHTYPETNYISIDLYTCGSDCFDLIRTIEDSLGCIKTSISFVNRGSSVAAENIRISYGEMYGIYK